MKTTNLSRGVRKQWLAGLWFATIASSIVCQAQLESVQSSGWRRDWYDEFDQQNTPLNSQGNHKPDASKWLIGQYPWGGKDLLNNSVCYSTVNDSYLDTTNGWLVLRDRQSDGSSEFGGKPFSFGIASSYYAFQQYGVFDIRAQFPPGDNFQAIWMLGNGWPPEIDIAEYFGNGNDLMKMALFYGSGSADQSSYDDNDFQNWHTYSIEWGPGYLIFYKDGVQRKTIYGSNVPSQPMYLLLNSGQISANGATFPYYLNIDYFRYSSPPAAAIDDNVTGTGLNQCNYSGTWGTGSYSDCFYGGVHWSGTANNYVTVQFDGTRVDVIGRRAASEGIIAYSVDGGPETLMDSYSANDSHSALLWSGKGLLPGLHTLKMRVTGTKNPSATGTSLTFDRVNVWNTEPCLTGTPIGTAGSNNNNGKTLTNALDGDMTSYFDGPMANGAWVGYDLGTARQIITVSYC